MTKLLPSLNKLLWDTDLVATRALLAIAELLWGILLAWPGETFGRPTYYYMRHVMPEEAWALAFLLSGITQLSIVLQQDFHSRFARYFAGWNCIFWCFVVASMMMSVYPPPAAISGEIALAMGSLWVCARPYILLRGYKHAGL